LRFPLVQQQQHERKDTAAAEAADRGKVKPKCVIRGHSSMEAMRLAHGALAFDHAAQVNLKITAATPSGISTPINGLSPPRVK
jgi:hypothetical protein